MLVLSGADLILPDGVQTAGTLIIEDDRISDIRTNSETGVAADRVDLHGHVIVPGFIDVHVHGVSGTDALDDGDAVETIARHLPRYGVTAFCPTAVACGPQDLRRLLTNVGRLRTSAAPAAARVLPAHLESNFINPEFRGAQPIECLRVYGAAGAAGARGAEGAKGRGRGTDFDGADIVAEIDRARSEVGIVTLAPEIDGAIELIRHLVSHGQRVSLGHSGATFDQARAAIREGACHATHLFNRMSPVGHREPGLAGAVLASDEIAAEIICDGVHVHPAIVRMAIQTKGVARMMAITDATAAAGLPQGATAALGGRPIRVKDGAAYLDDGTLAGSVATMDRVFRFLVSEARVSMGAASKLCATTAAMELRLSDLGVIRKNAIADLTVLDRGFNVKQTYVAGRLVYSALAN
jgi:N-acetylglucosamine-6-phosphate deacetylase